MHPSEYDVVVGDLQPGTFFVPSLRVFSLTLDKAEGTSDTIYMTAHAYFIEAGDLVFKDIDSTGHIWHRRTVRAGLWRDVQEVVGAMTMGARVN